MVKENDLRGMVNLAYHSNVAFLEAELAWLKGVMKFRYERVFAVQEPAYAAFEDIPHPDPQNYICPYTDLIIECEFGQLERFAMILALAPHLDPSVTEVLNVTNAETHLTVSEFGVVKTGNASLILPSGQTVAFFFFGAELSERVRVVQLFEPTHLFQRLSLLDLGAVSPGEPTLFGGLIPKTELLDLVWSGKPRSPRFGPEFPAKTISTNLDWNDLVLDSRVFRQLEDITTWLKYHRIMLEDWGMKKMVKPGYRALFFGPPGTGKTLCATLLGKAAGLDVFRIDLSMVVSKYIGETEKNLAKVFDAAERKNWILFFDEADALFGKRTKVNDSHDRYANQEVSYLLQRVEEYEGLVLLATNLRSNLDDAFTRRFQSIIHFPMPRHEERILLWQKAIPSAAALDNDLDLGTLSMQYELSGGAIVNAIQYACLQTIKEGSTVITKRVLVEAIRREYHKEGKTF
jgi:hypothetical protein